MGQGGGSEGAAGALELEDWGEIRLEVRFHHRRIHGLGVHGLRPLLELGMVVGAAQAVTRLVAGTAEVRIQVPRQMHVIRIDDVVAAGTVAFLALNVGQMRGCL